MVTTQDLSKIGQLSVVFRYISITENDDISKQIKICESFLGFTSVAHCTAEGLKTEILNTIEEYGINLSKYRGKDYDGANVMLGVHGRLKALIKEHAQNADYVHCRAHSLNLILNDAAKHFQRVTIFQQFGNNIYFFWQ